MSRRVDPDAQRAQGRVVWPLKRRATHTGIRAREALNDDDAAHASPSFCVREVGAGAAVDDAECVAQPGRLRHLRGGYPIAGLDAAQSHEQLARRDAAIHAPPRRTDGNRIPHRPNATTPDNPDRRIVREPRVEVDHRARIGLTRALHGLHETSDHRHQMEKSAERTTTVPTRNQPASGTDAAPERHRASRHIPDAE